MTPLGSNLREGSNPDSHHLGLLSEEKFWSRVRIEQGVKADNLASFTQHCRNAFRKVRLPLARFSFDPRKRLFAGADRAIRNNKKMVSLPHFEAYPLIPPFCYEIGT
jgi:hypothetical protein